MKKGCIIAIVIVAALVAVGAALFIKFVLPKGYAFASAGLVVVAETAVQEYTAEFGELPKGDHAKVLEILRGNNPKKKNFFGAEIEGAVVGGEIVDAWRNPLKMSRANGEITFSSAGPNGEHGDEDDVTGAAVRDFVGKIEEKAAEAETKAEEKAAE